MPHDGHGHALVAGNAAEDGPILIIEVVALLLEEVRKQRLNEVIDMGALGMPRQKDTILRLEIDAAGQQLIALRQHLPDLLRVGRHLLLAAGECGDIRLQLLGFF